MMMIKPVGITPANLYSSVPETDAPAWVAGTYKKGARVIQNHHVFESLLDSNDVEPAKDSATAPKWLDTGATNRWRMFDKSAGQVITQASGQVQRQVTLLGTLTSNPTSIEVDITPGSVVNALALFGLSGYQATITMTDPVDGVVYGPKVVSLVDPAAGDMWEWLFTSVERVDAFALTDLPAYGTARIHILVEAGAGGTAACSMAVAGQVVTLGTALMGAQFSITDFSTKEKDTFGNDYVTERGYSYNVTYPISIPDGQVTSFRRLLTQYLTRPAVFIGDLKREWTLIYGRFGDLNVVCPNGKYSECTLEVGALI